MSERGGCGETFYIQSGAIDHKMECSCDDELPCPECWKAYRVFVKRFDVWDASSEWDGDYLDDVLEARRAIEQREGG